MSRERTAEFLVHWLNTIESLGFILCVIIFGITIYHIYFQDNISSSKQKHVRGHNHKIEPKIKWLALLSILLYALSCLTNIFSKEAISANWKDIWFILTQFCWSFATITSYLLFICQLYIIYNKSSSIYAISKINYIIIFILIAIFAGFMFSKSILIVFLNNTNLTHDQYGKGGAITVYGASVTDLIITVFVLYLFNSRLTSTIQQLQHDSIENHTHQTLINVRLKHTILTTFALITSQLYLIIWSITVLLWYNYKGQKKDIYIYDFTITTLTFRTIACCTNSFIILLNFKFSNRYYDFCCTPILWFSWKISTYSKNKLPLPMLLTVKSNTVINTEQTTEQVTNSQPLTEIHDEDVQS